MCQRIAARYWMATLSDGVTRIRIPIVRRGRPRIWSAFESRLRRRRRGGNRSIRRTSMTVLTAGLLLIGNGRKAIR